MSGFHSQLVAEPGEIDSVRIDIGAGLVEILPVDGDKTLVTVDADEGDEESVWFEIVNTELVVEAPRNVRRGPEIRVRIQTPDRLVSRIKTGCRPGPARSSSTGSRAASARTPAVASSGSGTPPARSAPRPAPARSTSARPPTHSA
jgi:hypothetical protein